MKSVETQLLNEQIQCTLLASSQSGLEHTFFAMYPIGVMFRGPTLKVTGGAKRRPVNRLVGWLVVLR